MKKIRLKNILSLFTVFLLFILSFARAEDLNLVKIEEEKLTHGAIRQVYRIPIGDEQILVNLLVLDLNNKDMGIKIVPGAGKATQKATVSQMAKASNSVAMVNGDFFNMRLQGTPEGVSLLEKKLMVSPCVIENTYTLGINEEGAFIDQIKFQGKLTAANGASFPIDGLNKSYYWYEPDNSYSHQDRFQVYNDFWAAKTRGDKGNSEILLDKDGRVEQVSEGKNFDFPVPEGKTIIQASGKAMDFIYKNVSVGEKVDLKMEITPDNNWINLLGGHALLVDKYQKVPYKKDIKVLGGVRARTAAGVSEDGKTLYIASVEGRTARSRGISLNALSDFFVKIGAYRAINLDGGGSTAMSIRELGATEQKRVVDPERNAGERPVVNGLGVYNLMPATGILKGVTMQGPSEMIIGESAEFKFVGAYDTALQPMDKSQITYEFYDKAQNQYWNGNYMMAKTLGKTEVVLNTDKGIGSTKEVEVKDLDQVKVRLESEKRLFGPGENFTIKIIGKKSNGNEVMLSPSVFEASLEGANGEVDAYGNVSLFDFAGSTNAKVVYKRGEKTLEYNIFDKSYALVELGINSLNYKINDKPAKLDAKPFIEDSRTLVPIRFIAEAMGAKVDWDNENRIAILNFSDKKFEIPVDKKEFYVNGEKMDIDSSAKIKSSRTFVPIRFVAENLGMEVVYNHPEKKVFILSKAGLNKAPNEEIISETQPNVNSEKEVENRKTENRKVENRKTENRKVENRKVENRKVENKKVENKKEEKKKEEKKKIDDKIDAKTNPS